MMELRDAVFMECRRRFEHVQPSVGGKADNSYVRGAVDGQEVTSSKSLLSGPMSFTMD